MRRRLKVFSFLSLLLIVMITYNCVKIVLKTSEYAPISVAIQADHHHPISPQTLDAGRVGSLPLETIQADTEMKYILQWTSPNNTPFVYMGSGRNGFISRNCSYTNCYVTSDRNFFENYSKFDVIAFAGPEVIIFENHQLPKLRSPDQKYVFANIESAANYPVCTDGFDRYFNWTWTYKLDSDLRWGYMIVRDSEGKIVGPNKKMNWIKHEDMMPVSDELKKVLRGKSKTAAWFVSTCKSLSEREDIAHQLDIVLRVKYKLNIDIYGKCGFLICSRENETICDEMIRKDYYFYLSFENSLSEDYVTEKLLHAVQYNAIPIVFGGADYSRFLPEGSFLNAVEMNAEELAGKMHELINDFSKYIEYFKWTNHYSYHKKSESVETDDYCQMCSLLNHKSKVRKKSIYVNFKKWWNTLHSFCHNNDVNYYLY